MTIHAIPACTLWFTGLSGSGKSTLAFALRRRLKEEENFCMVLDGDQLRARLCNDLSFSEADRSENIRRIAEVARLMNEGGLPVLVAAISPRTSHRTLAQAIIGPHRYREVYVNAPLDVCEARDVKGLYAQARKGALRDFTGITAPYEPPLHPDLVLHTAQNPLNKQIDVLINFLRNLPERLGCTNGAKGEFSQLSDRVLQAS